MKRHEIDRRSFVAMAGFGVAGLGVAGTQAAEQTATEKANIKVVTDMYASWGVPFSAARIGAFLADNCVRGGDEIVFKDKAAVLDDLQKRYGQILECELRILQSWARGPVVTNERIDRIKYPDRTTVAHVVGAYNIKNGKIVEWRYFAVPDA